MERVFCICALCACLGLAGTARSFAAAETGPAEELLEFHVAGADGRDMGQAQVALSPDWTSSQCGDQDLTQLDSFGIGPLTDAGISWINADRCIAVRRPGARFRMPWPVYPGGQVWSASFADGTVAMLSLPEDYGVASGTATLSGEQVGLALTAPAALAEWQMTGAEPPDALCNREQWPPHAWIAEAECRSLCASRTGQGQDAALDFAAQTVERMLADWHARHGAYPFELDELCGGGRALVVRGPSNPCSWPEPLCTPPEPGKPGLAYTALQRAGQETASGYLLGSLWPAGDAPFPANLALPVEAPPARHWSYVAPSGTGQVTEAARPEIRLSVFGAGGAELGTARLDYPVGWTSFWAGSGDMLTMLDSDSAPLESGGELYFACDYMVTARAAGTHGRSPYAVEPNGQIWLAHFSDGTEAALLLPETYPVVSGEGTLRGESVAMMSISPVAFAIWQLTGSSEKPLEERFKEAPAEMWVAEADCNSILASNTGKGLPEALLLGAQAVNQLLQEFHAEHGIYPVTLEQLVRGTRAIASRAPGNAYVWPEPLTDDLRPKSALAPGLVYLGFGEERDGIVQNTGYALGVIGPGAAAEVPAAVAARFASPPAEVIKWFVGGENPAPLN